jgi:hypothetical protein
VDRLIPGFKARQRFRFHPGPTCWPNRTTIYATLSPIFRQRLVAQQLQLRAPWLRSSQPSDNRLQCLRGSGAASRNSGRRVPAPIPYPYGTAPDAAPSDRSASLPSAGI